MPCLRSTGSIICFSPVFRLRLEDGRRIFMEWHSYLGPTFFHDKLRERVIDCWWEDELICKALDWFEARGRKA